jgi:ankyrin repeat protein
LIGRERKDGGCNSVSKVYSHLRNILPEKNDGELKKTLQMMLKTPESASLQMMKYAAYLSSNNMLDEYRADDFLQWIFSMHDETVLKSFFSVKIPTIEALGTNMVASAVRFEDERILNLLLDANPGLTGNPSHWDSPLRNAVSSGNIKIVKMLLAAAYADVNEQLGFFRNNPLQLEKKALRKSASQGDIEQVRLLLQAGVPIDYSDKEDGRTALQAAAQNGHIQLVDFLLSAGANVNAPASWNYGSTALQAATYCGHSQLINLLLRAGANVNQDGRLENGRTALQAAAGKNQLQLTDFLLRAGANINERGSSDNGRTALQAAAEKGHIQLVDFLLRAGADINAPASWKNGRTALQGAAERGDIDLVRFLLRAGADVNAPASYTGGLTALRAASRSGSIELTQLLLASGADIGRDGIYTLCQWDRNVDVALVQLLLDWGADKTVSKRNLCAIFWLATKSKKAKKVELVSYLLDVYANSPTLVEAKNIALKNAVCYYDIDMVKLLLNSGADINTWDDYHGTPLQSALMALGEERGGGEKEDRDEGRDLEFIQFLLVQGADINAPLWKSDCASTELQLAALSGRIELVQLLLKHGADVNASGGPDGGKTALQMAAYHSNIDMVRLLLDAGAEVNAPPCDWGGRTAFQAAADAGNIEIALELLRAGADVQAAGAETYGKTALEAAADSGRLDMVQLLLNVTEPNVDAQEITAAIGFAKSEGHTTIAQYLKDYQRKRNLESVTDSNIEC